MDRPDLVLRTALLAAATTGVLAAAAVSPPGAHAAGEATCTSIGGGALTMYVNHPAVVPLLELSMDPSAAEAAVAVNGTEVGTCDITGITEVRVSSASGFGAWQVSDASNFSNGSQPARFWFGANDPVLVVHENPMTSAFWRATGGTGIDLDGVGGPDIVADTDYSQLTLVGSEQNDVIDLSVGGMAVFQGENASIRGSDGNDVLVGGAGSDEIDGDGGDDQVFGWTGADTLAPGSGADTVFGRSSSGSGDVDDSAQDTFVVDYDDAPDVVSGGGSDALEALAPFGVAVSNGGLQDDGAFGEGDTYTGLGTVTTGTGPDTVETTGITFLSTGASSDTVLVGTSPNGLIADGGAGTDTLDFSGVDGPTYGVLGTQGDFNVPTFPMNPTASFEAMVGSSGTDSWTIDCACSAQPRGGADDITFVRDGGRFLAGPTADGADTVTAQDVTATADYSERSTGLSLTLDGEANDGASGEGDSLTDLTNLLGGSGADTIYGDSRANVLEGGGGNDALNGRGGDDTVRGDLGADRVVGGSGADRLYGGASADVLRGGDGDDLLRGDDSGDLVGGNDSLDGGAGDDDEYGYRGNDTFAQGSASNGQDLLVGGLGTDLASYSLRGSAVSLSLNGQYDDGASGEGDRINSDVENLTGGRGADRITGNGSANLITGGAGKDTLSGLGGNDTFQSLDRLVDSLFGGTGTDRAHRDSTDRTNSVEKRF